MTRAPSPILAELGVRHALSASVDSDPRPASWDAHPPLSTLLGPDAPPTWRSRAPEAIGLACGAALGLAVVVSGLAVML